MAFFSNVLYQFVILYSVVMIHELFHFITASALKVESERICIMPYGVTLKIKNNYIKMPKHEIMIALAGPFSNILMIAIAYMIKAYCLFNTDNMTFFIFTNASIALINLIPALPLDGGRVLRAVLISKLGSAKAFRIMTTITKVIICVFFLVGVYILYMTKFNYSVLMIGIFLIFNLLGERKKNNLMMMKELIYYKQKILEKGMYKARPIVALYNSSANKLLGYISHNQFLLITILDHNMDIIGVLTEIQIIEGLIRCGYEAKVGDILNLVDHE